jgi:hypothetical protein
MEMKAAISPESPVHVYQIIGYGVTLQKINRLHTAQPVLRSWKRLNSSRYFPKLIVTKRTRHWHASSESWLQLII